jgi:hypothetical protein
MSISLIGILLVSNFPTADRPPESGQGTAREAPSGFWEFALRNRRFIALVAALPSCTSPTSLSIPTPSR